MKPKARTTGHVDGAWWPHGDDLTSELPDLLAVLSVGLGSIERVMMTAAAPGNACTIADILGISHGRPEPPGAPYRPAFRRRVRRSRA